MSVTSISPITSNALWQQIQSLHATDSTTRSQLSVPSLNSSYVIDTSTGVPVISVANDTSSTTSTATSMTTAQMTQSIRTMLSSILNLVYMLMMMRSYLGSSTGSVDGSMAGTGGAGTTDTTTTPQFTADDAKNYLLSVTQGGTQIQQPSVFPQYADQNSRFAKIGNTNEFDGVVARMYTAQFAGYAKGLDVLLDPGDNVNTVAANLVQAQQEYAKLNPEAKLFADVAALYRGDFGNRGAYDHAALKNLLVTWGRSDLANKSPVGETGTDAQTIGAVVQALNEQTNQTSRKAMLQQIFDFQTNVPYSPSGAVKNVYDYQQAVTLAKAGLIDKLMTNYNNGVGTVGSVNSLLA